MKSYQIQRGFIFAVLFGGMLLLLTGLGLATAGARDNPADTYFSPQAAIADYSLAPHEAYTMYLPLIFRRWPPIPDIPTLNAISNSDQDGDYTVSWSTADLATSYYLEEDNNDGFSSPTVVYNGSNTTWGASGKADGTYYYRVRGHNSWGYGGYSNVQSVVVETVQFSVDDNTLSIPECTTLRWNFTGVKAVYVSFGRGYDLEGVAGEDSRQVCPSRNTTYEALVINQDDSETTYTVGVTVSGDGCAADPAVMNFSSTTYEVDPGEKFSIMWEVVCAKSLKLVYGLNELNFPLVHQFTDMQIYGDTVFQLKIEKYDLSYVYSSITVKIKK